MDNDRWPRMTFYDILMKIGWSFIVGFYYVLKLFISQPRAPVASVYEILEFYRGREIRSDRFPWNWDFVVFIPRFIYIPGQFNNAVFLSLQAEKTFKLRIVFEIDEIDALKRYLYNNNLISTQSPFQKTLNFWWNFEIRLKSNFLRDFIDWRGPFSGHKMVNFIKSYHLRVKWPVWTFVWK